MPRPCLSLENCEPPVLFFMSWHFGGDLLPVDPKEGHSMGHNICPAPHSRSSRRVSPKSTRQGAAFSKHVSVHSGSSQAAKARTSCKNSNLCWKFDAMLSQPWDLGWCPRSISISKAAPDRIAMRPLWPAKLLLQDLHAYKDMLLLFSFWWPKTGIKHPFCHALPCSLFPSCVWVTVQPQSKDHLRVVSCPMLPANFTNAQPKQLAQAKIYRCSCQCPAKLYSAVKLGASSCTKEGWRGKVSTGFLCKIMTMYGRNCSTYFRWD